MDNIAARHERGESALADGKKPQALELTITH